MDGLLLLDKPQGPTSHDVVAALKAIFDVRKTGHAGTLDPLASGLLVILVGRATKLAPYVPGDPKVYEGRILLGISTDSLDIEGELLSEVPCEKGAQEAREALAALVGTLEQVPPMFSAAKYMGKPLYTYARRGEEVPRKSRMVRIYRFEMSGFRAAGGRAEIDFHVACSPGTYVRDLAARVGDALGCGGVISCLRRIASGPYRVEDAHTVQEIRECVAGRRAFLLPPERAVEGYGSIGVSPEGMQAALHGAPLSADVISEADGEIEEGDIVKVFGGGALLGMHVVERVNPFVSRALRII